MPSYNQITLMGRLCTEVESLNLSSRDGTALEAVRFRIAVDRPYKDGSGAKKTDFFTVKAFRQKAEFALNYLDKGDAALVSGRIETNEVVGQDGSKRTYFDVVADNFEFVTRPGDRGGESGNEASGEGVADVTPDDGEPRATPRQNSAPRAAPAYGAPRTGAPAPPPAFGRPRPAAPARRAPAPVAVEDDFDDADPFGDE